MVARGEAKGQRSTLPTANREAGWRLDNAAKPAKSATVQPTMHKTMCFSSSPAINTETNDCGGSCSQINLRVALVEAQDCAAFGQPGRGEGAILN